MGPSSKGCVQATFHTSHDAQICVMYLLFSTPQKKVIRSVTMIVLIDHFLNGHQEPVKSGNTWRRPKLISDMH